MQSSRIMLSMLVLVGWMSWVPTAFAPPISWDGGGDGVSWGDEFNWSGDEVPDEFDDVTIDVGGGLTVVVSTSYPLPAANTLTCYDALELMSGGALELHDTSTIATLTLSGGERVGRGDRKSDV